MPHLHRLAVRYPGLRNTARMYPGPGYRVLPSNKDSLVLLQTVDRRRLGSERGCALTHECNHVTPDTPPSLLRSTRNRYCVTKPGFAYASHLVCECVLRLQERPAPSLLLREISLGESRP